MPSPTMATPSLMKWPMTREVKKPRESLTTIGVFLICRTRSKARASASSPVRSPLMISTSGILSTGEKKCRPTKSPWRSTPSASAVIGRVEVLEHSRASGRDDVLDLLEDLVLERGVLEDGLDDGVAAGQVGGVRGRA